MHTLLSTDMRVPLNLSDRKWTENWSQHLTTDLKGIAHCAPCHSLTFCLPICEHEEQGRKGI